MDELTQAAALLRSAAEDFRYMASRATAEAAGGLCHRASIYEKSAADLEHLRDGPEVNAMDEDGFWKLIAELEDAVHTLAMWSCAYDANKKDRDEAAKDVAAVKAKLRVWLQNVNENFTYELMEMQDRNEEDVS